jgi:hypothetical protein
MPRLIWQVVSGIMLLSLRPAKSGDAMRTENELSPIWQSKSRYSSAKSNLYMKRMALS